MNCPIENTESAGLLLDYCRRKLAPDTTAFLERHMSSCARCRAFRDGQIALWRSLDEWESMPVSDGFDRRLYSRLHGPDAGNFSEKPRVRWWSWLFDAPLSASAFTRPAVPLALAGVMILAGYLVNDRADGPVQIAPRDAVEVEQVETVLEDLDMLRLLSSRFGDAVHGSFQDAAIEARS
ncbi:MAG: hypothetical protein EXQ52_16475 [Bryobacterales bacterium]|nr:hypothetical protein [Bryobacterales bacterium]